MNDGKQQKKVKYLTKTVNFGSKGLTLYSIDGNVWSSRKDELTVIMERHEAERLKLLQSMGEVRAEEDKETKAAPAAETSGEEPIVISDEDISVDTDDEGDAKPTLAAKRAAAVKAAGAKPKKKASKKDRVEVLTPRPRALDKKRKTGAKGKKKAA